MLTKNYLMNIKLTTKTEILKAIEDSILDPDKIKQQQQQQQQQQAMQQSGSSMSTGQ